MVVSISKTKQEVGDLLFGMKGELPLVQVQVNLIIYKIHYKLKLKLKHVYMRWHGRVNGECQG
jgi:hypothetical protein